MYKHRQNLLLSNEHLKRWKGWGTIPADANVAGGSWWFLKLFRTALEKLQELRQRMLLLEL